ncbi:gephyrin-like molybdotransferase Glp [Dethiosulfatibacter aminovorans]|nr:gephyrin-like molybdotransferase Glp [Dethiosulfatibacter aminovorans]
MKFLKAYEPYKIREMMKEYFGDIDIGTEIVHISEALDRYSAKDIKSSVNIPDFNKSTVDGYALMSSDTRGASESMPVFLDVSGEVLMGTEAETEVVENTCVYVPTGGMLPKGADAVVMIEYTEKLDEETVAVNMAMHPGENIIYIGEDISVDDVIVKKGRKITAFDTGALSAIGVSEISVFKKPRTVIISSGDEIRRPEEDIKPGEVRDINSFVVGALIEKYGGEVIHKTIVDDDEGSLYNEVEKWIDRADIVIVSGGSSAGIKDVTAEVLDSFGKPGLFVHGAAVKPGKPTIMSCARDTALIGLPGHPGSSSIIFTIFGKELFKILLEKEDAIESFVEAELTYSLAGAPGKETYVMGTLENRDGKYLFNPLIKKSAAISQLSRSEGYVVIKSGTEGINKGNTVRVYTE